MSPVPFMAPSLALTFWRGSELGFRVLPALYAESSRATLLPLTAFEVRDALEMALPQAGFRAPDFARAMSYVSAAVESEPRGGRLNLKTRRAVEVAWLEDPQQAGRTYVEWVVYDDRVKPKQFDASLTQQFGATLAHAAAQVLASRGRLPSLLGPGERIDEREASRIATAPDRVRDYSGCAGPDEVRSMHLGSWPAGRYLHFGKDQPDTRPGVELYLDDARAITIVGQAGSGKTMLVRRYAIEAQQRGGNVLLVSRRAALPAGWLELDVAHLDILPAAPLTPAVSAQTRELCAALVGGDAAARQDGEWLAAFMHLLLLQPDASSARLAHLVPWLLDESAAIGAIEAARAAEGAAPVAHAARSARFWSAKLHGLIGPRWEHGKRDPAVPYEAATARLLHAIEPFLPPDDKATGALHALADAPPIAMVLRPPAESAATGATFAAIQLRLEQTLASRTRRPLTVLLDDATRIARCDPARLMAAAQAGAATCIVSADAAPVVDQHDRATAQIWLMPLADAAASALNKQLGGRARQVVTVEVTARQNRSARVSWQEQAAYFHDADLRHPPGGRAPALVVLRRAGQPVKPVLTDLDPDALTLLVDVRGGGQYRTIGEALRAAPPYARIRVRPGIYREELELLTPVTIEGLGAAGDVVIAPPEWYCVTGRTPGITLINLTLTTESAYALRLLSGTVTAIGCRMSSIVEIGPGGEGRLHNCQITRRHLDGAAGARILVEDCTISSSESAESVLLIEAQAVLRRSVLSDARKCALLTDGGETRVEECTLRDVRYGVIAFGSRPVLARCVIRDVSEAAVLNQAGGDVQLDETSVDGAILQGDV